jgi:peptidoglycan/LPS O-acetylase OafA/YrhL
VLAYAIMRPAALSRVLNWRPLAYLGQRSYGAYLLHFLAIRIGYMMFGDDSALGGCLSAVVCLVLTVPAAELLYRFIEQPSVELGRRFLARAKPAVPR